jgi:hypothetical protein
MSECLELPRPIQLVRTVGWNAAESFGLPVGGYAVAAWLGGRDAGLWAMLATIWLTAVARKLLTGSVPSLVMISIAVLTVQTAAAIATGNLLIFLVHFPIANLALAILFARTARGHSPIAARLAAEVTVLWAGVFLLLAVSLGVLLATIPLASYVPVWAATTVVLIAAGIAVSAWWLRSVLRRLSISLRFAPAITA